MNIPVVPTPLTPDPPMICGFRYTVNDLVFNSHITLNVILLDQAGTPLSVRQVTMSGEDYMNWGNSDQYILDFICSSLGLTHIEPAAEEPAAEEPAVEEPAAEEPAVEEPAVEEPAAEESV
jgi:hypothetical protein